MTFTARRWLRFVRVRRHKHPLYGIGGFLPDVVQPYVVPEEHLAAVDEANLVEIYQGLAVVEDCQVHVSLPPCAGGAVCGIIRGIEGIGRSERWHEL